MISGAVAGVSAKILFDLLEKELHCLVINPTVSG